MADKFSSILLPFLPLFSSRKSQIDIATGISANAVTDICDRPGFRQKQMQVDLDNKITKKMQMIKPKKMCLCVGEYSLLMHHV
jgi:hypothetical protein